MASRATKTSTLKSITPTEFENLVFDLMIARGMSNVTWRTPGADGGRDIEGIVIQNDFSLTQTTEKWFVECKRYKGSVDWPTVWSKIAYADSNQADVLLMCISSQFTPAAITQVDNWNAQRRKPLIRLWPSNQIQILLEQHTDIAMKYGLLNSYKNPSGSILQLSLALSKAVGSHYSKMVFKDLPQDAMLNAANSLAQLLQARMEDIEREGRFKPLFFDASRISIQDVHMDAGRYNIDEMAFTAFIAYISALQKSQYTVNRISSDSCEIIASDPIEEITKRYKSTLDAIALWGDFEYKSNSHTISLRQRS
ncbi:restriction endonuclease [Pseudomonas sp. NY15463]|uniref:restriction endonuclease n=1 Tax=Pseudomonas sp. NY15463 TaxID=3400361 RepID=UPI003A85187B